jgi:HK97 family phage major capsid protein
MKLSEQITAKQAELVASRDVLVDLTAKMDDSQESQDAVVAATEAVEKATAELDRLKAAEAAVEKSVARAVKAPAINANPASRVKDSAKADLLVKSALVAFDAYVKRIPVEMAIEARYGDDEVVKSVAGIVTKATQNPAMTNVPGWAQELVRESYAGFMDLLRGESVIPRIPMTRYEFNGAASIKIPQRAASLNPNLAAAFRAEGAPIRVGAISLTSATLSPKSMGVIGTYTMELLERSTPSIEQIIRDAMIADTATKLDQMFLSNIPGSPISPAGMQTFATGSNTAASAGNSSANIMADVRGRLQQLASQNMGRRPVWVMNPARAWGVQLSVTAAGTPTFPDASQNTLMGIPVVVSTNVPSDIVFLIDAAELAFAGGAPRFMGTEVASIHEEDTTPLPIVDGAGVAAAPVRSLYQTASAALRTVWELDWALLRAGAVQTITGCAW